MHNAEQSSFVLYPLSAHGEHHVQSTQLWHERTDSSRSALRDTWKQIALAIGCLAAIAILAGQHALPLLTLLEGCCSEDQAAEWTLMAGLHADDDRARPAWRATGVLAL